MKLMTILASCAVSFMVMGTAVAAEKACPPEATKPEIGNLKEALKNSHNRGFLWKITKDGHASWLYGTIHVAQQSWLVPGPDVLRAVAQSQVVGLELDLSDPVTVRILRAADKPETAAWLVKTGRQKAVAEIAQPLCLSLAALGNVPLATQAEALTSNVGRGLGYYSAYGIDSVFAGLARSTHRKLVPLEEAITQRVLLVGRTKEEEARKIDANLKAIASGKALSGLVEVATMWDKSDLPAMEKYATKCDSAADVCTQDEAVMVSRNIHMAQKIADMHDAGLRVFAAVGSLHMMGPNGLPALMKKQGFTVEQSVPAVKTSL